MSMDLQQGHGCRNQGPLRKHVQNCYVVFFLPFQHIVFHIEILITQTQTSCCQSFVYFLSCVKARPIFVKRAFYLYLIWWRLS